MNRIFTLFLLLIVVLLIDAYFYTGAKTYFSRKSRKINRLFLWVYGAITSISAFIILLPIFVEINRTNGSLMFTFVFTSVLSKVFGILFYFTDDVRRTFQWIKGKVSPSKILVREESGDTKISRSEFITKSALMVSTVPAFAMSYGILSGAHDYTIHRITIKLKNLPRKFHGIKIAQLSDIHTGSFYNKTAVQGGIDMLLAEKPDMVVFTGDIVNTYSKELVDYVPVLARVKADLGVYSILGNHDYSDYGEYATPEIRAENSRKIRAAHSEMGWNLMLNENRFIEVDGEKIALLGCENWGAGRFSKYGDLTKTYQGSEDAPVKILLSHDPSHWDSQVRPQFPDIDIQLAGHTHGAQFGVEWGDFRWSPAQYIYKQWAGLYSQGDQHLYVNRGFGYIGIPSRLGIPPEITILTLETA